MDGSCLWYSMLATEGIDVERHINSSRNCVTLKLQKAMSCSLNKCMVRENNAISKYAQTKKLRKILCIILTFIDIFKIETQNRGWKTKLNWNKFLWEEYIAKLQKAIVSKRSKGFSEVLLLRAKATKTYQETLTGANKALLAVRCKLLTLQQRRVTKTVSHNLLWN